MSDFKSIFFKIDVYDFFNNFLKIRKTKFGFWALCPFHNDKNPSFFFNNNTKKYYCFACKKKGNILNFIMDYKNLNFFNSVKYFYKFFNIKYKIKKYIKPDLMNVISNIYFKNLQNNFLNPKVNSFFFKRKIQPNLINFFSLGFSENNFSNLYLNLFNLGYSKTELTSTGCFFFNGFFYSDRFKNRIIFPIKNIHGRVIAFGGRILDEQFYPKYLNSPETKVFSKRNVLYGLYEAITSSKFNSILIVEGYIDVLTLHTFRIKNVASVLGTSFTENHFNLIKSVYKNIIFCYDGDNAGRIATIRTAFSCINYLSYGIFISFVILPDGFDPDSFLNSGFKNIFFKLLKKPIYILDLIFNRFFLKFEKFNKFNKFNNIDFFLFFDNIVSNISNFYLKKLLYLYFFRKYLNSEFIFFESHFHKINYDISSIFYKASCCVFLNYSLHLKVDLNKFIFNFNAKFFSDFNNFFEILLLLKIYKKFDLDYFNFFSLNKFKFTKRDFAIIINFSNEELLDYFNSLLDKIYLSFL